MEATEDDASCGGKWQGIYIDFLFDRGSEFIEVFIFFG